MSDPPKIRKFIFHIRKKSVFLASGLSWLCLKPSLRSGFKAKPFEPRKILFLSHEKWIYCFWSVFYKKNTISVSISEKRNCLLINTISKCHYGQIDKVFLVNVDFLLFSYKILAGKRAISRLKRIPSTFLEIFKIGKKRHLMD